MCFHRRLPHCTTQETRDEEVEKHAGEALEGRQEKTGHTESCLRVARRGHTEQGWAKIEGDGGFSHWASKGAQADEMSYIFVLLPPKPHHLRYRVCLSTIYSCGLRLEEGIHLQVKDIDGDRMMIHVRHGKGAKERYVPLPEATLPVLS